MTTESTKTDETAGLRDVTVREVPLATLKAIEPHALKAYREAGGGGAISWPAVVRWALNDTLKRHGANDDLQL